MRFKIILGLVKPGVCISLDISTILKVSAQVALWFKTIQWSWLKVKEYIYAPLTVIEKGTIKNYDSLKFEVKEEGKVEKLKMFFFMNKF